MTKPSGSEVEIPMAELRESPENGRIVYEEGAMKDLMQSIKGTRQEEALVVRPSEGGYEIVDGHRRFRALQGLGYEVARCMVRSDMTQEQARLYRVATIFQRRGGTPYEEARYLAMALKNADMTRPKLCQMAGIKPGTLKARLEILEFPEDVARRIGVAGFGMEHARLLAQLANKPEGLKMAFAVVDGKDPDSHQTVGDLYAELKKALTKADLARDPHHNKLWGLRSEMPTFEGQAAKLEHLAFKTPYREEILVLDVEGFDNLVAKGEAAIKRRREKEAKAPEAVKDTAAEKRRIQREERERKVRTAAREWLNEAVPQAAFTRLKGIAEVSSLDLGILVFDSLEPGVEDVARLAEAAGIPQERLQTFLDWDGSTAIQDQALIRDSKPAELVRLVLAVHLDAAPLGSQSWPHVRDYWTGKTQEAWQEEAQAAAKARLKGHATEVEDSEAEAAA